MRLAGVLILLLQASPTPLDPPPLLETFLRVRQNGQDAGSIHERVERTTEGARYRRETRLLLIRDGSIHEETVRIHAWLNRSLQPIAFQAIHVLDGRERSVLLSDVDVYPDAVLTVFAARRFGGVIDYRETPWGIRAMTPVTLDGRTGYVDRYGRVVEMDLGDGAKASVVKSEADLDPRFRSGGSRDSGCFKGNR